MRRVNSIILATACATLPAQAADPCRPETAEVVRIADVTAGDTLTLTDGRTVRLAGLMAPRSLRSPDGTPPRKSRAALTAMFEQAETVRFAPADAPPDRYGRVRGDVFVTDSAGDETRVQERLLAGGHAILTSPAGDSACLARLEAAETAAMAAGAGLWSDDEFAVVNARDPSLGERTGLYAVVEGRVATVGGRTYMTFLDFGRDYRRDFTAMITPKLVDRLAETGVIASDLAGRRVEVRGVIEESGGPAIRLRHASDLRVLDE